MLTELIDNAITSKSEYKKQHKMPIHPIPRRDVGVGNLLTWGFTCMSFQPIAYSRPFKTA